MKVKLAIVCIISVFIVSFAFKNRNTPPPLTPYYLEYDSMKMEKPVIPADNPLTVEGVALGRMLFYDPLLSVNNTQSCGSCHLQKYSFTDGKPLSIGALGDTLNRNSMPLINLAWSHFFFWDGRIKSLEQLVFEPITNPKEMGETEKGVLKKLNAHPYYPLLFKRVFNTDKIEKGHVEKSIAQFLRTIISNGIHLPPEVLNTPPEGVTEQEFYYQNYQDTTLRGFYFRFANMCGSCHRTEIYNDQVYMASNQVNPVDIKMKVPPLLNISYTAPYMHDGRFNNLEQIAEHYHEHIAELHSLENYRVKEAIPNLFIIEYDKKMISKFFTSFNDTNIIINKKWSNPFEEKEFSWKQVLTELQCE